MVIVRTGLVMFSWQISRALFVCTRPMLAMESQLERLYPESLKHSYKCDGALLQTFGLLVQCRDLTM